MYIMPTVDKDAALKQLTAEILGYERKYGLSSNDLRAALNDGRQQETNEIVSWLIALDLKARIMRSFLLGPEAL